MKKQITVFFALIVTTLLNANNIAVSNIKLTGQNPTSQYTLVQFDISWENSFRVSTGPANWDAAWVFIKFRVGNYVSAPGATSSGTSNYFSGGGTSYGTTITVYTTSGLVIGMPVTVTDGIGAFAGGTVVTEITNSSTFKVSAAPTTALSGATVTGYGTIITVINTTGLIIGMPVNVTSGQGAFAGGTFVTAITNATTFRVSSPLTTALSGGAIVTGYAFWQHAILNSTGHFAPNGSTITPASDGTGAFIYRNANGTGTFSKTGIQLRWNYGANGVADNAIVDIKVFAIEMVYVPQGSFALGSGGSFVGAWGSDGCGKQPFYLYPTTTATYPVTSENAITIGTSPGNLYYAANEGYTPVPTYGGDQSGPIPAAFPKGFNAFYCMKYEISQQEYVDFLNSLTRIQQNTRTYTSLGVGVTSVTNRYVMSNSTTAYCRNGIRCDATIPPSDPITFYCDLNGNGIGGESDDGQCIACNYLGGADFSAYLDWSGLRPMTELEFEKACRGTISPVANEYAWGTPYIDHNFYTLNNNGANNEVIASNYSATDYISAAGATSSSDANYISAPGAKATDYTVTVSSTTGLSVGMPIKVTAGALTFSDVNTYVTAITNATHFTVSNYETYSLSSDGTIVTGYGDRKITVGSTTGLIIGMPVSIKSGLGAFAPGTVVIAIMNGTTFSVSDAPVTPLSGGAIVTGYACGNATFGLDNSNNYNAPMRVGIFAGTSGNTGRVTAGATYYGIMEMSGNLYDREISIGRAQGRVFTGTHGNGTLDVTGNEDVSTWPSYLDGQGFGYRGGSFSDIETRAQVSDRIYADAGGYPRGGTIGGRGVRTAP